MEAVNLTDRLPTETLLDIFCALQAIWPAGTYSHAYNKVNIGWVTSTHVCRRWREVWLSKHARRLWANYATTFYNEGAIAEFLRRASDSPLCINLDMLHEHSEGILEDTKVLAMLVSNDIWSRARKLSTHARHTGYPHYSEKITSLISTINFSLLCELDIFLPHSLGRVDALDAPSLRSLALSSDASAQSFCPLTAHALHHIFLHSPHLRSLFLNRVVDAREQHLVRGGGTQTMQTLEKLDLGSFDERLLKVVAQYFHIRPRTSVRIELFDVESLADASQSALSLMGQEKTILRSVNIRFEEDSAYGESGLDAVYQFEFCAVEMTFTGGQTLIFRMDERHPSWAWNDLVNELRMESVSILVLGESPFEEDEAPPAHYAATALMRQLRSLDTLYIEDRLHIPLLDALPSDSCLKLLVVELPFGVGTDDVLSLSHWLRSRNKAPKDITSIFKGNVFTDVELEDYHDMEAPVLAAFREMCTLHDERTFTNDGSSNDEPYSNQH